MPSLEEYLQMVVYKTGTLARISAKLGTIVVGGTDAQLEALGQFAETIGIAFQIQDDILNLVGEKYAASREAIGEDISEGKRTMMVIHACQHMEEGKVGRLEEILDMHTKDQVLINEAIDILKEAKSIEYSQEYARRLVVSAWDSVDDILEDSQAKRHLKLFADYLVDRDL